MNADASNPEIAMLHAGINKLADFVAPRKGYRGGDFRPDSEEIPKAVLPWLGAVGFVVVLVLHLLRQHAGA